MLASKVLMLMGSALASSKLGQSVGGIELDDVLGVMGLARRRSHLATNLALLGAGACLGAGAALLLAPASGSATRKRLSEGVERLTDQAAEKLEQARRDASTQGGHASNGPSASFDETAGR